MTVKKILVIEIDTTDFDVSWTVEVTKSSLWLDDNPTKQLVAKRSSREDLIFIPPIEENSFIKSVTLETHES